MTAVNLYDTTLRDGTQGEGVSLSCSEIQPLPSLAQVLEPDIAAPEFEAPFGAVQYGYELLCDSLLVLVA